GQPGDARTRAPGDPGTACCHPAWQTTKVRSPGNRVAAPVPAPTAAARAIPGGRVSTRPVETAAGAFAADPDGAAAAVACSAGSSVASVAHHGGGLRAAGSTAPAPRAGDRDRFRAAPRRG